MSVPVVGLRVVRGPDWKWRNLDGGEGHVGTVVDVGLERPASTAVVVWDGSGGSQCCRIGAEGAHDLRVFDSAPCGIRHGGVSCAACQETNIAGTRWKCCVCCDVDLCTSCYMSDQHETRHQFYCAATPDGNPLRLPTRAESTKREAKGLFPGASVVPGRDWQWDAEDECPPIKLGTVLSNADFASSRGTARCRRDAVLVQWTRDGSEQACRVGHGGKVDVQCDVSSIGGSYYPDHLPVLGLHDGHHSEAAAASAAAAVAAAVAAASDNDLAAVLKTPFAAVTAAPPRPFGRILLESPFNVGDKVRVVKDPHRAKILQQGHGGWIDDMVEQALGKVGSVVFINAKGDLRVKVADRLWTFNPRCLEEIADYDDNDDDPTSDASSTECKSDVEVNWMR